MKETALAAFLGGVILLGIFLVAAGIATGVTAIEWLLWNHLIAPAFHWPLLSFLRFWLWQIAICWVIALIKAALR